MELSNYKLGNRGSEFVLADFTTGDVRVFNSAGKYLHSNLIGTPKFLDVNILSLTQVGSSGVLYNGVVEKEITNPTELLSELLNTVFIGYPLRLFSKTDKGIRYKQYILCYNKDTDLSKYI